VKPVPRSSREQVGKAIGVIDEALHFVDHHYTGIKPTMYDRLDIRGGSDAILWIVQRGLAARDDDFKLPQTADVVLRLAALHQQLLLRVVGTRECGCIVARTCHHGPGGEHDSMEVTCAIELSFQDPR